MPMKQSNDIPKFDNAYLSPYLSASALKVSFAITISSSLPTHMFIIILGFRIAFNSFPDLGKDFVSY